MVYSLPNVHAHHANDHNLSLLAPHRVNVHDRGRERVRGRERGRAHASDYANVRQEFYFDLSRAI